MREKNCLLKQQSKDTNKYGVRRFTVNIIVSTQVNVDGFLEKTFSATFKIVNYYHFVKGEKGEVFHKQERVLNTGR